MPLPTVQRRLDALHQQSRIAAGSLIVTVFGDAVLPRGGAVWLGSLIALMQTLGLNERLVRTSVFRLVKDEWLQTETQGRRANYHLTATGQRRFEDASRHIYAAQAPAWDHQWRMVMLVGEMDTRKREALRRALRWQGFGELSPSNFVHPGADLQESLNALRSEGLAEFLPKLLPLMARNPLSGPSANDSALVQNAWNLELLAQDYSDFLSSYAPLLTELDDLDGEAAFVARTLMIHDFRRILLRDPELPAELLPTKWPGQQARDLCRFLYRGLLGASEAYLDQQLQLASGEVPEVSAPLSQRFA
jgi:phenylacetic acid degradation operon negative regulatory protein